MADRGDTHYSMRAMNLWFLVTSVLLLLTTLWMVLDDYNRSWKRYQREFRKLEVEKTEQEIQALESEGAMEREAELTAAVEAAERDLKDRRSELVVAEEELRQAKGEYWRLNETAKKSKAGYNWERFLVEEERDHADDPTVGEDRLAHAEADMVATAFAAETALNAQEAAQQRLDAMRAAASEAQTALSAGTRELERIRKRQEQLEPSDLGAKIASRIRDDIPGLDFIGPTIKVQKELPPELTFELNFTKKRRIDMCSTCHLGMDREGFEEEQQPFATHPRLDLYLTAKSPHPVKDVGCTICHRGAGEALHFVRADHRPSDAAEAHEWEERYHWHKQKYWDYPMLSSDFVEASCVQCHRDSMELIASDAPTVTEGYRLFERYGCYACHKVEWFPTQRKPGPTLANLQAKLSADFVASWVGDPRGFRPTTWMPQLFHLENFAPDEVIAKSSYGEGPEIRGEEWNGTAVDAIVAFLFDSAPLDPLPDIPVEGDAYRGREVMRLSGCFACHNTAPYGEAESKTIDPTQERHETNEHGPNLRGVATKLTPEWLFHWIKNPSELWNETRMPNLRLSDQDAADIVAFVMEDPDGIFKDVPESWSPKASPSSLEVLREQARWFFARDGRSRIEKRFAGEDPDHRWDDPNALKIAVGEKLVAHYGCFSCHAINGMETLNPIGTELTNWGSKTVDKLDFGFSYKKALAGLEKLDYNYREGWLMRKLGHPRSFDLEKIKNPIEKLRMGWFGLDDEQIQALATFVVGLVDDEVKHARMKPTAKQAGMDTGLRAIRQNNCIACHSIEPGRITYRDADGKVQTVAADLVPFEEELLPKRLEEIEGYLAAHAEEYGIEEVGFRLLRTEPGIGGVGDKVFVPLKDFLGVKPAFGGEFVNVVTSYYLNGGVELFDEEAESEDEAYTYASADPDEQGAIEDVDGQFRVYMEEPFDKVRWTFAPPVLWNEGHKVQGEWFYSFLRDVRTIRPQIRVRMPSFHLSDGEAAGIVSYFAHASEEAWPARYARALRAQLGLSAEEVAEQAGLQPAALTGIENGSKPAIAAGLGKLKAFGDEHNFQFHPPVRADYEASRRRLPAYLAERMETLKTNPLVLGDKLAVGAVNCFQCHYRMGKAPPDQPIAWAPDLALADERLREDWLHEWLVNPQAFYPGTAMPANFGAQPPQFQDVFPASSNEDQIQVVLDWLFNLDQLDILDRPGGMAWKN